MVTRHDNNQVVIIGNVTGKYNKIYTNLTNYYHVIRFVTFDFPAKL